MSPSIVALAPNSWDGQWVNRQQLLSRLGRTRDVVYSNGAWSVWDRATPEFRAAPARGGRLHKDNITLDQPSQWLLRWPRFKAWDDAMLRSHARQLRHHARNPGELIAYLCHPVYLPYLQALRPRYVVYHCYDLYERQPGWTGQLEAAERALLSQADLVFSPTRMLSDELERKVPCDARVLANAADVDAVFAALRGGAAAPPDLAAIPHPRIGYVGSVHPELDWALIAELAQRRPAWQFVLIGPPQKTDLLHANPAYQACCRLANVHLLGKKHRSLVPAYLLNMDVNTLLYRPSTESWTHVAYPLKLHEYFASGHPVVSVGLPTIREFEPLLVFADSAHQWEHELKCAIESPDPQQSAQRRAVAAQNSWDHRVEVLSSWLDELPALRERRLAASGVA